jgi:dipeptidyl aminopeptidase/acylaminoacyl peptidase
MLGLAGREARLEGDGPYQDQSSMIQAVCAAATPTDLLNWGAPRENSGAMSMFGASAAKMAQIFSPITWAAASAPPFLLIHGTTDTTVPYSQAESMAKALRTAGAKNVTLLAVDAANHSAFVIASQMTRSAMMAFFDSTIGNAGKPPGRARPESTLKP